MNPGASRQNFRGVHRYWIAVKINGAGGDSGPVCEVKEGRFAYIDPFYSESNMKALLESVQQAKEGKIIVKTMTELEQIAGEDSALCTYNDRTE